MSNVTDELRSDAGHLVPLLEPPVSPRAPDMTLPAHSSAAAFRDLACQEAGFSTHVFPAAWPRSRHRSVQNVSNRFEPQHLHRSTPKSSEGAETEAQWYLKHNEEAGFIDVTRRETYEEQDQLWICANRYFRRAKRARKESGLTLLLSHATGMHKETYEPLIAHLFAIDKEQLIDEMWALDCVNQGDSSLLNRDNLGDTFHWSDSARDITKFVLEYLPPLSDDSPSYVLARQKLEDPSLLRLDDHASSPVNVSASQFTTKPQKWRGRHLIAVGHSIGGACSVIALASLPRLFSALVLIDPIAAPSSLRYRYKERAALTVRRRDRWPSRQAAAASFAEKKDFFGRWAAPVLQRYVECGLSSTADGKEEVTLKTRKQDEAICFADPVPYSSEQMGGARLAFLPSWLAKRTLFLHPGRDQSAFPEYALAEMLELAKGSQQLRLECGHLIVQERPKEAAEAIFGFLQKLSLSSAKL